ncbi:MAG: uroporphyrinogen-III C-methyltransferase [Chloroflexi bacterium]|nr:uroporphyrinogen-III C-methyltransferase [Chloroflexota bacterium]MDA8187030.1 uroporphyrinogen-III C-methyltransferase [Dehalococcoidales bacterium]
MAEAGKVYLVGAGPGDPGLISIKGLRCVEEADVVVYDRLIDRQLLDAARPDAEMIYVGKAASQHTLPQDDINALLVARARDGKVVTRLKGGDPFVFGRGGEEAEVLVAAGVPFEVVPGVTSAIAVPAYAGIPLTHRDYASTVAIITGREDPTKAQSGIAWEKISTGAGTLVFLMGMKNLPHIVEELLANGRAPDTPIALISWGTGPLQRTLVSTLADVIDQVREVGFHPPAVIVVGDVVSLREKLRWFDNRPLFGKRVLVTRAREQAGALSRLLEEKGAVAVEVPTVRIEPPTDADPFERAIAQLESYDWVIFTSANGVNAFMNKLGELDQDVRALKGARLCAIGPATAAELKRYRLRIDFVPDEFVAEAVIEGLRKLGVGGKRILLPRAEVAREVLPVQLREAGAAVDEVAAYRTTPAQSHSEQAVRRFLDREIDIVTFTSSSTVRNLVAILEANGRNRASRLLDATVNACIGPITAQTAEELGIRVDVVAREYTIKGLVDAVVEYFQEKVK